MQFMHEEDLSEAMARALDAGARGVFNVIGASAVPLSVAISATGGTALPMPEILARRAMERLFRFGFFPVPADAMDFIKYPCTIDGSRFADATEFIASRSLEETLQSIRH